MIKRRPKPLFIILVVLGFLLIMLSCVYMYLSGPVDSSNNTDIEVVIPSGTSTKNIGKILKEKNLIRNELFFSVYVKLNSKNSLKASVYTLRKSMGLSKIVNILTNGNNYNENVVTITFKEGMRLTDYAKEIASKTNNTYEQVIDVCNDKEYLNTLINKYWFLTDDILDSNIYYPLEGYLAPNTYQFKDKDVSVKDIVKVMLDQTDKELAKYKDKITVNIHYYITMASIVELEGTNTKNRKMIVGVFNNRLKSKMNIGSDVTTYYALQYPMTSDLTTKQFATVNPYNTRGANMEGKMPIGPICNPSMSSIEASVNPTDNNYLYFVADKNKEIFYSRTLKEHEALVQEIKDKGDWIW